MTVWLVKRNNHGFGIVLAICASKARAEKYLKRIGSQSRNKGVMFWVQREKVIE